MAITRLAFPSALHSRFLGCCFALVLETGCGWNGIRPVHERISLAQQASQAIAVVFAEPVESRFLHHRDKVPASAAKGSGKEYVPCEAVEKILRVRQVLRGPVETGSILKMATYEIEGVPGIANQPAVFFLTREKDTWRPFTDFGTNAISLPGFPDRPLVLSKFEASSLSKDELNLVLINALLDPHNATDWPMFKDVLDRLVSVALDLATQSGILAKDPGFITDKLAVLVQDANPAVAAAARKELLELTSLCNESGPIATEWGPKLARNDFMEGRLYAQPGNTPEERERTFWRLKAYSCSNLPQVRSKAEALLHRYFPSRKTIGCEICQKQSQK
jgi:hypothetical protein